MIKCVASACDARVTKAEEQADERIAVHIAEGFQKETALQQLSAESTLLEEAARKRTEEDQIVTDKADQEQKTQQAAEALESALASQAREHAAQMASQMAAGRQKASLAYQAGLAEAEQQITAVRAQLAREQQQLAAVRAQVRGEQHPVGLRGATKQRSPPRLSERTPPPRAGGVSPPLPGPHHTPPLNAARAAVVKAKLAESHSPAEIEDLEVDLEVEMAVSAAEAAGLAAEKAHAVAAEEELQKSASEELGGADVVSGVVTEL